MTQDNSTQNSTTKDDKGNSKKATINTPIVDKKIPVEGVEHKSSTASSSYNEKIMPSTSSKDNYLGTSYVPGNTGKMDNNKNDIQQNKDRENPHKTM